MHGHMDVKSASVAQAWNFLATRVAVRFTSSLGFHELVILSNRDYKWHSDKTLDTSQPSRALPLLKPLLLLSPYLIPTFVRTNCTALFRANVSYWFAHGPGVCPPPTDTLNGFSPRGFCSWVPTGNQNAYGLADIPWVVKWLWNTDRPLSPVPRRQRQLVPPKPW